MTVGATRGDGERGDDVTHNLRTMPDVPLRLDTDKPPKLFEVRGEVYMTRAELIRINRARVEAGEKPYENCRNLTAGSLKLLDPKQSAERKLRLFAYALGAVEGCIDHVAPGIARDAEAVRLPGQPAHAGVQEHR